ncbi:MAG: DNA polymerase Y family protein, partial [Pseudomonadota bacterium]
MGTRVLSLWLPYFTIDRIRHEQAAPAPGLRVRPRATYGVEKDHPLSTLCPFAERAGLVRGQPLAEALKAVPGLLTFPDDASSDQRFLQTCASWCERYTPFVAVDRTAPGQKGAALWLDIGSAAHLAGGEATLLARLLGQLEKKGLTARAAIADHPGTAWAACRFGDNERRILPANAARV